MNKSMMYDIYTAFDCGHTCRLITLDITLDTHEFSSLSSADR